MLLNPNLTKFWQKQNYRYRVLYGGRSSSKSHEVAGMAVYLSNKCKMRVLCARQFQNRISDSIYALLKSKIEAFNYQPFFKITNNSIINTVTGSEFLFYGIARNLDEMKSLEGIDLTILEEAHNVNKEQLELLEPTILRKNGSQMWVVFNPDLVTDYIYHRFIVEPPKKCISYLINYPINPFLSESMLEVIQEKKEKDPEGYRHVYLGEPRENADNVFMKRSWLLACVDAHKALGVEISGKKRIGQDIADGGKDKNALAYMNGQLLVDCYEDREDDGVRLAVNANNYGLKVGADLIVYDSIGVGAKFKTGVSRLNPTVEKIEGWNAGGKVYKPDAEYKDGKKNKDMFVNAKAQAWQNLADRVEATYRAVTRGAPIEQGEVFSISGDMPSSIINEIINELSMCEKDFDSSGKLKVQSKKELAFSPNKADAIILANAEIRIRADIRDIML